MADDINTMAELIDDGCLVKEAGIDGFFDSVPSI
jgi:hypothetical protein